MELDFKTFILGLAKVAGSGCNAEPPGAGEIFGKNVVALLPEEIDVTAEAAVKETEFKTHVVFVGAFPCHTIVGILSLIDAGLAGKCRSSSHWQSGSISAHKGIAAARRQSDRRRYLPGRSLRGV